MSVERTYYCEGPDCGRHGEQDRDEVPVHVKTASPPPYLPVGVIETRDRDPEGEQTHHFCSWDCVMKYAAAQPVPEVIE